MSERLNYPRIRNAMEYVQHNHTYVNRVIELVRALCK
jgi:hypothetical protein